MCELDATSFFPLLHHDSHRAAVQHRCKTLPTLSSSRKTCRCPLISSARTFILPTPTARYDNCASLFPAFFQPSPSTTTHPQKGRDSPSSCFLSEQIQGSERKDPDCFAKTLLQAQEDAKPYPIFITEFNDGLGDMAPGGEFHRDMAYAAAFIFHNVPRLASLPLWSWWTFTDGKRRARVV